MVPNCRHARNIYLRGSSFGAYSKSDTYVARGVVGVRNEHDTGEFRRSRIQEIPTRRCGNATLEDCGVDRSVLAHSPESG